MVELNGIRYAVGPATARWLLFATGLAIAACTLAIVTIVLASAMPSSPSWASVTFLFTLMTYTTSLPIGGFVALTIWGADKQRIVDLPPLGKYRWRQVRQRLARSDAATFLRSGAGPGLIVLVFVLLFPVKYAWFSARWLHLLTALAMVIFMCTHTFFMARVAYRIWRQTKEKVDDQIDRYREFDWRRFDSPNEVERFRKRYRNRRWRPPSLIQHPAHAERLALEARNWRLAWVFAAAGAGLLALAFAAAPLQHLVTTMAEDVAHLDRRPSEQLSSIGQQLQFLAWVVLLLLPVSLQQHFATNMENLAKVYDDCALQLRLQRERDKYADVGPWVGALPRRHLEAFVTELALAASTPVTASTDELANVISRWQHVANMRQKSGKMSWRLQTPTLVASLKRQR